MADNFAVLSAGVADEECTAVEGCSAVSGSSFPADSNSITIWVEVLNAVQGEVSAFEVRDPSGAAVLSGRLCEPLADSFEQVFLRYSWSGVSLEADSGTSGEWTAVYLRNGQDEVVIPFALSD